MRTKPQVVIVGVGLIGGSLGLALKRVGRAGIVRGVSRAQTLTAAKELGAVDETYPYEKLGEAVREADIVFLATPIHRILDLLSALAALTLPRGVVITDVGSTKELIVRRAGEVFSSDAIFIGGHPMAGSEKRGVRAADPYLFQNAIYVLCPSGRTPPEALEKLGDLLESTGARVLVMDCHTHDRVVAAVSHLPQLLAVALVNFAASWGGQNALKLAAGGFRDMTRIAASSFSMWGDIIQTNSTEISTVLTAFAAELTSIAKDLDIEKLRELFDRAACTRSGITQSSKGFLRPLAELLVVVEDRPGIIASIAQPLAEAGINIRDIEVLKVREGEGGTLRLAFENREVSECARQILAARGFSVRHREA